MYEDNSWRQPDMLLDSLEFPNSGDLLIRIKQLPDRSRGRPPRKDERMKVLNAALRGESLRSLWESLKKSEKIVVTSAAYASDGRVNRQQIVARYGEEVLKSAFGTAEKWNYSEKLNKRLFLFLYPPERSRASNCMPKELQHRLREFAPPFPEEAIASVESLPERVSREAHPRSEQDSIEVPLTQRNMEIAAQHDLIVALRFAAQGKMTVSEKTLQPTAATTRNLAAALHEGDFFDVGPRRGKRENQKAGAVRAHAWPLLLQAAKLVRRRGNKLELSKSGRAALSRKPHEMLKSLWSDWVFNDQFDEFARVGGIKRHQGRNKRWMTDPYDRRTEIADVLCDCPAGQWVHFDELVRFMQADDRQFEVTEAPHTMYLYDPEEGNVGSVGDDRWNLLQTRYLLCFLFEYVASLGMIDVAYTEPQGARQDDGLRWSVDSRGYPSRHDGLEFFRVNALGTYCLEEEKVYAPSELPTRSTLTVLPNRNVQVSGELSVDERLLLGVYAVEESENVWHLDGDRILSALETGYEIKTLCEFLAARDEQELPERVEGFFRDIEYRSHAMKQKGAAVLIECADAEIAERIAASRGAGKFCERVGERGLVVPAGVEEKFKEEARALGYGMLLT